MGLHNSGDRTATECLGRAGHTPEEAIPQTVPDSGLQLKKEKPDDCDEERPIGTTFRTSPQLPGIIIISMQYSIQMLIKKKK